MVKTKVQFQGRPAQLRDFQLASVLEATQSRYGQDVRRQLDQLESLMNSNPWLTRPEYTRNYVWALFAAQWATSGRAMSTMGTVLENFVRFRVDPWRIEEARERVSEFGILNGIKRYIRNIKPVQRRFKRRVSRQAMPWVESKRPTDDRESEYQCFWALVCVTGNRPHDVFSATVSAITRQSMNVTWITRKVKSGVTENYQYAWSAVPPAWVQNRWRVLSEHPWRFTKAGNMASCLNKWLAGKGSELTSSSPRERLDAELRQRVEAHELTTVRYELLMDHRYETAVMHYNGGLSVQS